MYSDDARRAGSIDHDRWTAEAERIGDLPTKESLQSTYEPMGQTQIDAHDITPPTGAVVDIHLVSQIVNIVIRRCTHIHRDIGRVERRRGARNIARIFQGMVRNMQKDPLLRIHVPRLSGTHAKEGVIEHLGVLEEVAMNRLQNAARAVRVVGVVRDVEATGGDLRFTGQYWSLLLGPRHTHFAQSVQAILQDFPELRNIRSSREVDRHSYNGDGLLLEALLRSDASTLGSDCLWDSSRLLNKDLLLRGRDRYFGGTRPGSRWRRPVDAFHHQATVLQHTHRTAP